MMETKESEPTETLGERVAKARKEKGWGQARLAEEVNRINPSLKTPPSTISSIETNISQKPTIIVELAQALGVSERWLKTGKSIEPVPEVSSEAVSSALLGTFQAFGLEADDARLLAQIVLESAEEPLSEHPDDFGFARRVLAASATRRFLASKGIRISRS